MDKDKFLYEVDQSIKALQEIYNSVVAGKRDLFVASTDVQEEGDILLELANKVQDL